MGWALVAALIASMSVAEPNPVEITPPSIPTAVREELAYVSQRSATELFQQRFRIIKETGIRPGMTVAQIGVRDGVFTTLLARAVSGTGIVFAVDDDEGRLARVQRRAFSYHVDNIVSILGDGTSIPLPTEGVQIVLMLDSYNRFEHPEAILKAATRALIPHGELVLVDKHRIPGVTRPDIAAELRGDKVQAIETVTTAGLTLTEEKQFLEWSYFLRFRKEPEPEDHTDDPPSPGAAATSPEKPQERTAETRTSFRPR